MKNKVGAGPGDCKRSVLTLIFIPSPVIKKTGQTDTRHLFLAYFIDGDVLYNIS